MKHDVTKWMPNEGSYPAGITAFSGGMAGKEYCHLVSWMRNDDFCQLKIRGLNGIILFIKQCDGT
jgi:hypothetical protein